MVTPPHHSESENAAEVALQKELRGLFLVDTQTYLERYSQIAEGLAADTWEEDIQELYRCIHTIKGGAVTVGAEAILHVSTALEELLSALRYLDTAPPLEDQQLIQILLEAGELLSSIPASDTSTGEATSGPALNRIEQLHEQIRQNFLNPEWDERAQLFFEFAEQGFDLVVLDLEMGLEQVTSSGPVEDDLRDKTEATLAQLSGIGRDLEMGTGWWQLLAEATSLMLDWNNELSIWKAQWPQYLKALKICAKQGGEWKGDLPLIATDEPNPSQLNPQATQTPPTNHPSLQKTSAASSAAVVPTDDSINREDSAKAGAIAALFDDMAPTDSSVGAASGSPPAEAESLEGIGFLAEDDLQMGNTELADPSPSLGNLLDGDEADSMDWSLDSEPASNPPESPPALELDWLPEAPSLDSLTSPPADNAPVVPQVSINDIAAEPASLSQESSSPSPEQSPAPAASNSARAQNKSDILDIQVPVPLQRLDRCAQFVVQTILAVRSSQQRYDSLRNQLLPLIELAKESVQYIAQLRQVQNDYTLLNTAEDRALNANSPNPERYRQGYLTINRLMENSLRLTELGAEAERFIQQTSTSLQTLERSVQQLQTTVEESRLVPFRTLAFRARAILRDLTTRYDKPARLEVEGESLSLDAGTIRQLEPVLLHLLRNAFDHGLESPEIREALGKDPQGTVVLSLQRRGSRFIFCIRDDGGGVDTDAIAAIARDKNLPHSDVSTPQNILDILTQPGFSSKATATDLSGRGVGMDVVLQQVEALDGLMRLETTQGQGTAFYIDLPVPHLLVRCVLVQSDRQRFAIPADDIALTVLADQLTYFPASATSPVDLLATTAEDNAPETPVLDLFQHWYHTPSRTVPPTAICMRVDDPIQSQTEDSTSVWLRADDLIEQIDLPIEELPSPLVSPPGLLGVSLQGDGSLIPVLDAIALRNQVVNPQDRSFSEMMARSVRSVSTVLNPSARVSSQSSAASSAVKHVLVVDDAALMRRRIEASLTASGYRVTTREDGLEAWNWLQENEPPDLVISDIEMPQMDGFTLLERCRSAQLTMPFLVVSSRLSEEWSNEALRLGATDFLTKGFSSQELLKRVEEAIATVPQLA